MKKIRIIALVCVLALLVTVAGAAAAEKNLTVRTAPKNVVMSWNSYKLVNDGDTVNFLLFPRPYEMYEKQGSEYCYYGDIVYNTEETLSAKSSASWIKVSKQTDGDILLKIKTNTKQKKRTATVTVTGSGFKATLNFTQYGCDKITSVKRDKNKVTVNIEYGDAPYHMLYASAFKGKKSEQLHSGAFKKKTFTFKVKKGWSYHVSVSSAFKTEYGYNSSTCSYVTLVVKKVTGTEKYKPQMVK